MATFLSTTLTAEKVELLPPSVYQAQNHSTPRNHVGVCIAMGVVVLGACAVLSVSSFIICWNMRAELDELKLNLRQSHIVANGRSANQMTDAGEADYDASNLLQITSTRGRTRRHTRPRVQHEAVTENTVLTHPMIKAVQFQMSLEGTQITGSGMEFTTIQWKSMPASHSGSNHRSLLKYNCTSDTDCSTVIVREHGLYFIYAQLLYRTSLISNSFRISVTSSSPNSDRTVLRCDVTVDYVDRNKTNSQENARLKTCHTSGLISLAANDVISLVNSRSGSMISTSEGATYWGLIKLTSGHGPRRAA